MKKFTYLLLVGLILLAGCANSPVKNLMNNEPTRKRIPKTTMTRETEATSSATTTQLPEIETETYVYQNKVGSGSKKREQTCTETLTYQGDQFITIKKEMSQFLDEEMKAEAQSYSVAEFKKRLTEEVEKIPDVQKIKAVAGVTFAFEVTEAYEMKVVLDFDFTTLDRKALLAVGESFGDLSDMTKSPQLYIAQLKLQGAKKLAYT